MELTNEKVINAPRARVYDALHDVDVLRQSIPGCQALAKVGADDYQLTVALKVGPVKSTFSGTITVYDEDIPSGFSLRGVGHAAVGSAEGHAHVALAAIDPTTTNLAYHITADLTGQMNRLEATVLETTARAMAAEFFSRLSMVLDANTPITPRAPRVITPHSDGFGVDDRAVTVVEAPYETVAQARVPTAASVENAVIMVGPSTADQSARSRDDASMGRESDATPPDTAHWRRHADDDRSGAERRTRAQPLQTRQFADGAARDLSFGQYNRAQTVDDDATGPLHMVWRGVLVGAGLLIIFLLLTDGI